LVKKVFMDHISGATSERPGLEEAMEYVRDGDTLAVWRLDRLGRSLRHLIDLVGHLQGKNIGFKSLQESIDTTSSGGRLIFHIFRALAEFERNLIRERTTAGLTAARARGRKGGRPKELDPQKIKVAIKLHKAREHTVKEICKIMGISKPTFYKYVHESPVGKKL
jgi:DNA invertase Pin-like site-specific DNA recombinase